ncbi:hypothetical protein [Catenovulum sediminis]|uniref:hypothetical protein n=1 Tax=Catenovulum sediminis TaxID=1740262 RepID=UPI00117C1E03|nr:hypothetical protein [Catenovulum sediminis]
MAKLGQILNLDDIEIGKTGIREIGINDPIRQLTDDEIEVISGGVNNECTTGPTNYYCPIRPDTNYS